MDQCFRNDTCVVPQLGLRKGVLTCNRFLSHHTISYLAKRTFGHSREIPSQRRRWEIKDGFVSCGVVLLTTTCCS